MRFPFLFLVKVEGLSCWPHLRPGKRYLATSLGKPQKGDFLVFRDEEENRFLVKRVVSKEGSNYHVASTLSFARTVDDFGLVPLERIEGKLIY